MFIGRKIIQYFNRSSTTSLDRPAVEDTDSKEGQTDLDAAQEPVLNETSDSNRGAFESLPSYDDTEGVEERDTHDMEASEVSKFATSTEEPKASDTVCDDESKQTHSTKPSKPTCLDVGSDFILLGWVSPQSERAAFFEIKYKFTGDKFWNRKSIITKNNSPQTYVGGLLQATGYTFKVRAQYADDEGEFSEPSDSIQTTQSPALSLRDSCTKLQDGEPASYKLPLVQIPEAKNEKFKTRKCEFGTPNPHQVLQEKTIMMIGATGSGKSTLIDGMVNHLLGVKWEDDFRFKIIDLMTDEEARKGSQTETQTDWITSYTVHPVNKTVKFTCNIIDTPGFGDTRGIERDHQLVGQINAFFKTKGVKGIEIIDAICFVTQAPLARLTHVQRYVYESILSIFGKDMEDNIVAMITFADGKEPPVLNALVQAEVPIKKHFLFNNSALFEPNTDGKCNKFGKMFWDMGSHSYGGFFDYLPMMKSQSLQLTAEVLLKREQLNVTIAGLLPQIDQGLGNLETMRQERDLLDKFSKEIEDNKEFTYEVDEFHQNKIDLKPRQYVTNCTYCNYTCHFPCGIPDDGGKAGCWAMTDGRCRVCPEKCRWDLHRTNDFRIEVIPVKVKKTYTEMKQKFEMAEKSKVSKEQMFQGIREKFVSVKNTVCNMIEQVRNFGNYLRQNAIKSNTLTEMEYLDNLIKSEQQQKRPGFQTRIDMLQSFRRYADIQAKSTKMSTDDLFEDMGFGEMDWKLDQLKENTKTEVADTNLPELAWNDEEGAMKLIIAVQEGNLAVLQQFEAFFKSTSLDYKHFPVNPMITVAVFGSSKTAECVRCWNSPTFNWNAQEEIPSGVFGGLLDKMKDRKATPLYVATFLKKVQTVKSLIKYSDEQNIAYCMSNIQLENSMESVYMTELGERLKTEYQGLNPAVVPGHHIDANGRLARVFIVYSPKVVHATNHMKDGIGLVMIRNPYMVNNEAMIVSTSTEVDRDISSRNMERSKQAINSHSSTLWRDHSNLNVISVCTVRSKRKGNILEKCLCVVLYCSTKGVVPLGEKEFPSALSLGGDDSINIDVREGYFEFGGYPNEPSTIRHEDLKMGCNVGVLPSQNGGGTIGPFVQYEGTIGFLTCAHVLFDVAQQPNVDFTDDGSNQLLVVQPAADASPPCGSPCGFVHRAIFNPSMDISIDVAVVTISDETRLPSKGRFANDHSYKYREAGFDELPEYNNGVILPDVKQFGTSNLVVKFGSETHLTKGFLRVDGTQVRPLSTALGLPSMAGKRCMNKQYEVIGDRSGMNIFQPGDSGSAVFMLEGTSLHCIGIAIGHTTYGTAVVTPIQAILDALGSNANIELQRFDE